MDPTHAAHSSAMRRSHAKYDLTSAMAPVHMVAEYVGNSVGATELRSFLACSSVVAVAHVLRRWRKPRDHPRTITATTTPTKKHAAMTPWALRVDNDVWRTMATVHARNNAKPFSQLMAPSTCANTFTDVRLRAQVVTAAMWAAEDVAGDGADAAEGGDPARPGTSHAAGSSMWCAWCRRKQYLTTRSPTHSTRAHVAYTAPTTVHHLLVSSRCVGLPCSWGKNNPCSWLNQMLASVKDMAPFNNAALFWVISTVRLSSRRLIADFVRSKRRWAAAPNAVVSDVLFPPPPPLPPSSSSSSLWSPSMAAAPP